MFIAAVFTMAKIWKQCKSPWASQVVLVVKNPPARAGGVGDVSSVPGLGRCPGGGNGNHSSILAWRIPRTEEQSRTQLKRLSTSIESPLVGKWIKEMRLKNIIQLILFRNRRKSCHLDNMDETRGHYIKWNKLEKDKYCYDLICPMERKNILLLWELV